MLALLLPASAAQQAAPVYQPVLQYDPNRDAAADIDAAVAEARRSGRHVLIEVGGKWCGWCHRLDDYLKRNRKLAALLERNFVMVKVNYSPENENEEVLSGYPEVAGYPHFFVLDGQGKLLHSQDTAELEKGKSYHARRVQALSDPLGTARVRPIRPPGPITPLNRTSAPTGKSEGRYPRRPSSQLLDSARLSTFPIRMLQNWPTKNWSSTSTR